MNRTLLATALSALLLAPLAHAAEPITDAQYAQVLQGDWRSADNRARDRYRHPQQTLEFFAVQADQTVIEITPGGGWYSEILAPLLKPHGQYVAALQASTSSDYDRKAAAGLRQKFAADPARYAAARTLEFDPQAPVLGPPASADRVLTFRNVHNWVLAEDQAQIFGAFFKVLKPGGVLGVVDHRAKRGAQVEDIKQSGYLPVDYVIELATAAGFQLQAQSEVNANPKDTKDYPAGVWTLPPGLKLGEQDRARYLAIGESDRFTLSFVKPGASQ